MNDKTIITLNRILLKLKLNFIYTVEDNILKIIIFLDK